METEQGKKKTPKKVWWFKENLDVFESKLVRKLRMKENGDSLFVIYHKLRLLAAKNYGEIKIENYGDSPAEDIAFSIQEKPEYVEIVLEALEKHEMIVFSEDNTTLLFPEVTERICTESDSKERVRRFRERQKQKQAEIVTCNGEIVTEPLHPLQGVTVTLLEENKKREEDIKEDIREREEGEILLPSWIDEAWEKVKTNFPRKDGLEKAKPQFLEMMASVPNEEKKHTLKILLGAIELSRRDHDKNNSDDSRRYKFFLSLNRWLTESSKMWIDKALEVEAKMLEEARRETEIPDGAILYELNDLLVLTTEEQAALIQYGALVVRQTDALVYEDKIPEKFKEQLCEKNFLVF